MSHLYFYSCLEADAIRDGCLKVSDGVVLLFHLWGHWRLGQVHTPGLTEDSQTERKVQLLELQK